MKRHLYLKEQVMVQLMKFLIMLQIYLEIKIVNQQQYIFIYVEKGVLIVQKKIYALNVHLVIVLRQLTQLQIVSQFQVFLQVCFQMIMVFASHVI